MQRFSLSDEVLVVFAEASSLVEANCEGPTARSWISSSAHWQLTEKEARSRMFLVFHVVEALHEGTEHGAESPVSPDTSHLGLWWWTQS